MVNFLRKISDEKERQVEYVTKEGELCVQDTSVRLKSNRWSFSQRTPVMWWARGRCGIIFPWLARGRASVPPNPPLHKQEPRHLLLLGSQCPRGLVALFNILIGEKRLRFVRAASSRGCPRAHDRSLLINFGTNRLARTWMMLDKGKLREKLRRGGEEEDGRGGGLERGRQREKERKRKKQEQLAPRRIQYKFDTRAKSPFASPFTPSELILIDTRRARVCVLSAIILLYILYNRIPLSIQGRNIVNDASFSMKYIYVSWRE